MSTISVSLICRNSSDVLERCLESVKDADEIVICDTGSSDNTLEIARKYTDKVFEYWLCNEGGKKDGLFADFAKARNYSLSKCTSTHVLTIDSDEILEPGAMEKLKAFTGTALSVRCIAASTGEVHYQPRLYLRHKDIYWKGAAHNYLTCYRGEPSDITITYFSNKQREVDKDRTMRILQRYLKENPKSAREMYYLGKEYHKRGWFDKAVKILSKYVKLSTYIGEKADAFVLMSRCYAGLGRNRDAVNCVMAAINTNPDFKEALLLAGDLADDSVRLKYQHIASVASNSEVIFNRPLKRLKVTVLSKYDWAGSGYRMSEAIHEASGGSIDIEAITEYEGQGSKYWNIKTGTSISRIGMDVAATRIQSSDIIHFKGDWKHDNDFCGIVLPDAKRIYTVSGSVFRNGDKQGFEADFLSAMTPDLCVTEEWVHMPHCWNEFIYCWKKSRKIVVSHVPSNAEAKGTRQIIEIMTELTKRRKDVEFIWQTNISYKDSILLKKNSHLYIDQLTFPIYANASLEAMSMGIPVVSNIDRSLYSEIPPIITCYPSKDLQLWVNMIDSLLNWTDLKRLSEVSFEYVKKTHGRMGERWIQVYKMLS